MNGEINEQAALLGQASTVSAVWQNRKHQCWQQSYRQSTRYWM